MNYVYITVGVILVVLGVVSLVFSGRSWTEKTTVTIPTPVVRVTLPAERERHWPVPPTVTWGAIVVGTLLVVLGVVVTKLPTGDQRDTGV